MSNPTCQHAECHDCAGRRGWPDVAASLPHPRAPGGRGELRMSEGRMTAEQTPDIEAVRRAVAGVVCNVSNLPAPLQAPALGLGMGGLIDALTQALAPVLAAAVREARAAAWDEGHAVGIRPYGDHANPYRADRIAVDAPECPRGCLNRLAPQCVIHRTEGGEGR